MARPDHFTRPVQSDRLSHDYGNTRLGDGTPAPRFSWVQAIVIAVGFWGALFLFALVTP